MGIWNKFKYFIRKYINIHLIGLRYNEDKRKDYKCLENPLYYWWKCRKYFKFPLIKFRFFYRKYHDCPWFYSDSKILSFRIEDLMWKTKFGEVRYENSPYIYFCLFQRFGFYITFGKSYKNEFGENENGDLEYWEYLMNYYLNKNLKRYSVWQRNSKLYEYWDCNTEKYIKYYWVIPVISMSLNKRGIKQLKKELNHLNKLDCE